MNWIQGEKFIKIADWVYSPLLGFNDYRQLQNTLNFSELKNNDIIYTHTFYVKQLFNELIKIDKKVKIITHNCDVNVDFEPPDNVVKWYSQNVNIKHPRIISIPIGLENDYWMPSERKREKMIKKGNEKYEYYNLVYMNHDIRTNPVKRLKPYQVFRNKSWVTVENRKNGQEYDRYIDNIFNHRYMICPEGNGMDTHRTWECLYMGTIPIEKRNINNMNFEKIFPILIVDDWEDITEELLLGRFQELAQINYSEKLDFNYWNNIIYED